jgi:dihydroflavonol-4-reductase
MRAFVTGATGFIGGRLARALSARGDDVTVLARDPARARALGALRGVTVAQGDITDAESVHAATGGHDAVFHLAAWYALGVRDRARMEAVNVGGTSTVLAAARDAGIARTVYCSTIAALGRAPHGGIGNEDTAHPGTFGSAYEETKRRAHDVALSFAAEGLPLVVGMPGATYGPGDHSMVGLLLRLYAKRILVACPFQDTGLSWVHVADVAQGLLALHDKGRNGEAYVLGGDNETIAGMFARVAPLTGLRAPASMPNFLLRAVAPISGPFARLLGQEPDLLREGLASLDGSWMFSSDKAAREIGYVWRAVEEGVAETVSELRRPRG